MCSASDYKSPMTSWQFFSVALGRPFHTCEPNSLEILNSHHLPAHLVFSSLLPTLKLLWWALFFICANFPLPVPQLLESFSFPKGNHRMLSLPSVCSVLLGFAWACPSVPAKCKKRCCNSAWGDGQGFTAVTNPDKGRKCCSFPHKADSCRKMSFFTVQI